MDQTQRDGAKEPQDTGDLKKSPDPTLHNQEGEEIQGDQEVPTKVPTDPVEEDLVFLSREAILEADDAVVEVVAVPEWGGHVRVKGMTGTERDSFESSLVQNKGKKSQYTDTRNIRAKLASLTLVDGNGERMFSVKDVNRLGQKSAAALDRVFSMAQKLSKITDQDLEELAGNSEEDRSDDSSAPSP